MSIWLWVNLTLGALFTPPNGRWISTELRTRLRQPHGKTAILQVEVDF